MITYALRIRTTLATLDELADLTAGQQAIMTETGYMFTVRDLPGLTVHNYYRISDDDAKRLASTRLPRGQKLVQVG